ncbi:MAG: hypothetical protein K2M31_09645 [Muribaculaceae bacterium]|nr:hypothetical protein [Muribaculaceae bacterium]
MNQSENSSFMVKGMISSPSDMTNPTFEEWMKEIMEYSDRTISSRSKNLKSISEIYGDLEDLYKDDNLQGLLEELTYSRHEQRNNQPPKHKIPINGDPYTGTATYKSTVKLYKTYLDSLAAVSFANYDYNQIEQAICQALDDLKATLDNRTKFTSDDVTNLISIPLETLLYKYLSPFGYTVEREQQAGKNSDLAKDGNFSSRDRYDIIAEAKGKDLPMVIIEIDTHRADQVSKKMLSRVALNNASEMIYVSLIYPNEQSGKEARKKECEKYCLFMNTIFKMFMPPKKSFISYWL